MTAIIFNRVFAMPNKWTFQIPPIGELVRRYVGNGKGWADPFAGRNLLTEFTNDIDPDSPAQSHTEADAFCLTLPENLNGAIIDPPYSNRQVSECYRAAKKAATYKDTSGNFRARVNEVVATKIKLGGLAITCGWNTGGLGKGRGFEIIEILIVYHGGSRNDTLTVVEQKITDQKELFWAGK